MVARALLRKSLVLELMPRGILNTVKNPNKAMNSRRWLIVALVFGSALGAAQTAPLAPDITIKCVHNPIERPPEDPTAEFEQTRGHVEWQTENATKVWILGDESPKPPSGKLAGGEAVVMIAVGPGGTRQSVGGCTTTSKIGTGRYGLILKVDNAFDLNSFRDHSYVKRIARSNISPTELNNRLAAVLQSWGYTMADGPTRRPLFVVRYTPQYNERPGLCDARCQAVEIHKEVAFVITIEVLNQSDAAWDYEIRVMPSVLMRYQREGGDFKPDPDGVQIALPICQNLVEQLSR